MLKICYSEEDDTDFIRWTANLLRRFIASGDVSLIRQFGEPDIMLASIWRTHLWPNLPVVLVSNENWVTHPGFFPLDRYAAVISTAPPPVACRRIAFPYAAVHYDEPIEKLYAARHNALAAPKTRFCCFVASNDQEGELAPTRLELAQSLQALGPVDIAGRIGNNTGYMAPRGLPFLNWICNYRYMVCLENARASGYLTEKPLQAWLGGAVPIYDGGAKELLNPAAYIDAAGDVFAQIRRLEADPAAYEAMRREPLTREPFSLAEFEREFDRQVLQLYAGRGPIAAAGSRS